MNADQALQVESKIPNGLYRCDIHDYVFNKKNQVITMENKVEVSITGKKIGIDLQILFQRLVTVKINSGELKKCSNTSHVVIPQACLSSNMPC